MRLHKREREVAIFLCDLTGIMAQPWVDGGFDVILVDPQHPEGISTQGPITKVGYVVDHASTWGLLRKVIYGRKVAFVAGFPVCTELAISGTRHWSGKREVDPNFQAKAMQLVHECRVIGELSGAPYMFENPVSAISSIYRKPDHTFNPNEYGGYLPVDDVHPIYPDYFPPRDAYGKKTCLWVGNGFIMPKPKPVPIDPSQLNGNGGQSKSYSMLGGKSDKTKNIRSATPRGFATAVYLANGVL